MTTAGGREPDAGGMLDVGDGHRLAWTAVGRAGGLPALALHGGPGSGSSATTRGRFDPAVWRLVQFDQRGCGRSVPHAANAEADLSTNTTAHLIADIERLRDHLGIERWMVHGGSWGSTLALAYVQRHTDRVSGLVLAATVTTGQAEVAWIVRGVGRLFPEAWERFVAGVPTAARDGDLADAYHRLLMDPDPAVHDRAARDWCDWEQAVVALQPGVPAHPRWADPRFRLGFARLVTHYWRNAGFLEEGALLRDAPRLGGIPGILVHGRLDLGSPLDVPWWLARAWPGAELRIVEGAGHDTRDAGMPEALATAVADMAERLTRTRRPPR
ncbi:MAG: prolyl aminopeptidase [Rhodospirillales bacterium]